ncbi:MAG TPA: energy transducer TonB, partial [Opitutaceae bacterium]
MPRPAYPAECRKKGIEGKVLVDFVVCPDGTTSEIKAFRGPDPLLAQAAMATIARTTFVPGTRNGVPVYFHLEIPIVFSLNPELPEGVKGIETVKPDHPPSVAFAVPPQYPPEFVSKRVEGAVLVKFTVCPDGTTTAATAVQASDKRLIPFALQAILRWRFKPGTKNGVPVYCELEVPLVFKAEKPKARAVSDTAFDAASDADALLAKGAA